MADAESNPIAPARVAALPPSDPKPLSPKPAMRKLRVYAFDPQASKDLATAVMNDAVISLPWEKPWEEPLSPGPCGEYLEVIDHDPVSGLIYAPVDLEDPYLLAQDGLPPSEGRPQFHQQMVYAVAMKTIRLFERALGRSVIWAREPSERERQGKEGKGREYGPIFEKKLRIHPHALREANAYYSPQKTALLFGYFKPPADNGSGDEWVFTCLSQDIIAHETAHAILHGVHRRSIRQSNPDTLAFHEGFADIVALFQHFTMTEVVAHQIGQTRGTLRGNSLLTGLARQFGEATGRGGSLRYALDIVDRQRKAEELPTAKQRERAREKLPKVAGVTEPHARGGFLVAAVFDAFVTIYERRTADLLRIALGSSSPTGAELSPDLVRRLAAEATKAADHLLRMCVRALDYIPPIDMHFGEYLRAIVTADADLIPDDPLRYRVAVAEAFRKCGITVPGCMSMAPDSLMWEAPCREELPDELSGDCLWSLLQGLHLTFGSYPHKKGKSLREQNIDIIIHNQIHVWRWLQDRDQPAWDTLLGVHLLPDRSERKLLHTIRRRDYGKGPRPKIAVYSARVARRSGPDGQELSQLVVQVAQRRAGYFDADVQRRADSGEAAPPPQFWFRGGATLLIDLRDGRLRNVVRKRIDDDVRLEAERAYHKGARGVLAMDTYRDPQLQQASAEEPFALIHRS